MPGNATGQDGHVERVQVPDSLISRMFQGEVPVNKVKQARCIPPWHCNAAHTAPLRHCCVAGNRFVLGVWRERLLTTNESRAATVKLYVGSRRQMHRSPS